MIDERLSKFYQSRKNPYDSWQLRRRNRTDRKGTRNIHTRYRIVKPEPLDFMQDYSRFFATLFSMANLMRS
jgi:hypothetical protein